MTVAVNSPSEPRVRWGFVSLGAWLVLVVAGSVAMDERWAAVGATSGIAGASFGLAAVAARVRSESAEDGAARMTLGRAVSAAVGLTRWMWVMLCVLYAAIWAGQDAAKPAGLALGIVAAATLVLPLARAVKAGVTVDGVDREILLRAASFSFFVTVFGAGGYALFEGLLGAPHLSMWVVWTVGMFTWAISTGVVKRRLS